MTASQSRKHRGYRTQDLLAEHLREHGFPYALAAGAGRQGTDVTGTPGIDWEVKARRGFNVLAAMKQAEARAVEGFVPVSVLRYDGMGPSTIGRWPFIVPLDVGILLLREAGYGLPNAASMTLEDEA